MTSTATARKDSRPLSRRLAHRAPPWSRPAALRGLRAAVVVPLLLVLTFKVIGNPQMATYAAFGSFANLVLASFAGSRRDRLVAHLGLGLTGSVLLSIGTSVNATTALAAAVTLVVTFVVLMAGVTGPKAAAGGLAAMLAYVLAAASPGTSSMIPSRLEGWWLATAAAAAVVVVMTPRRTVDQLRVAAATAAGALAAEMASIATGTAVPALRSASLESQARLRTLFNASPTRPTGVATADQALGATIELLEWVTVLVGDTVAEMDPLGDLDAADLDPIDRALLRRAGEVLVAVGHLLVGGDELPDLDRLEELRLESVGVVRRIGGDADASDVVHASFHARTIALAVRAVAADAIVAARRADPAAVAALRMRWLPGAATGAGHADGVRDADTAGHADTARDAGREASRATRFTARHRPTAALAVAASVLARHSSLRSVWVRNSARGAVAVAAAVTVADLTNVQHGFWVVLGTLTVLRTTATETGGTALRAVLGAAIGFLVGAVIVVAVGTDTTVLWAILPVAVFVAAYTPGAAPFTVGQAAFTAMLVVLYNLLIPVGWKVGAIRVEDIAVGCVISLLVGAFFWPRGATAVMADDLHDAFVSASGYLVEASGWALGLRSEPPGGSRAALIAGLRLDDALRAYLTEQGAKSVPKDDLWTLVGAAQRLRLTAASVAELPVPSTASPQSGALRDEAEALGDWYVSVARHITQGDPAELQLLEARPADATPAGAIAATEGYRRACQVFVDLHLRHLRQHLADVIEPAGNLGRAARRPWWHPAPPPHPLAVPAGPPA